jgi:hypothetical protein
MAKKKMINRTKYTARIMTTHRVWNGTPEASEGTNLIVRMGNCPYATLYNAHNLGDLPDFCDYCYVTTDHDNASQLEHDGCGVQVTA